MRLLPVETSTVLLGLRLLETCRTEHVMAIDTDDAHLLERPEFRDYEPILPLCEIQALRDKINLVNIDVTK